MNAIAPLNGRSSAEQFLADHDHMQRELMLSQDENRSIKEQLNQASNMAQVLARELDAQKSVTAQERARANMWLAHTMKLVGQLDTIQAAIASAKETAIRASQEAAVVATDQEMEPDDEVALKRTVGTATMPMNRLA